MCLNNKLTRVLQVLCSSFCKLIVEQYHFLPHRSRKQQPTALLEARTDEMESSPTWARSEKMERIPGIEELLEFHISRTFFRVLLDLYNYFITIIKNFIFLELSLEFF